jgi:Zn-dependent protease
MSSNLQYVIILFPVLILSMSIHEVMHAIAADRLGDDTARLMGRISLNPLRHIDPFLTIALPLLLLLSGAPPFGAAKPVQVNFNRLKYDEFGAAIVGIIGPLTNLVIALVAALLFNHLDLTFGSTLYQVIGMTVLINVGFFLFNVIPWPPLDGSRVLYAFAPRPLQEVMESIERTGIVSLLIFFFLFYTILSLPFSNAIIGLMNHLAPGFIQFLGL